MANFYRAREGQPRPQGFSLQKNFKGKARGTRLREGNTRSEGPILPFSTFFGVPRIPLAQCASWELVCHLKVIFFIQWTFESCKQNIRRALLFRNFYKLKEVGSISLSLQVLCQCLTCLGSRVRRSTPLGLMVKMKADQKIELVKTSVSNARHFFSLCKNMM